MSTPALRCVLHCSEDAGMPRALGGASVHDREQLGLGVVGETKTSNGLGVESSDSKGPS